MNDSPYLSTFHGLIAAHFMKSSGLSRSWRHKDLSLYSVGRETPPWIFINIRCIYISLTSLHEAYLYQSVDFTSPLFINASTSPALYLLLYRLHQPLFSLFSLSCWAHCRPVCAGSKLGSSDKAVFMSEIASSNLPGRKN